MSKSAVTSACQPLLVRDSLYFSRESGITRDRKPWLRLKGLKLESPYVVVGSRVYVGTNKGLACFK